MAFEVTSADIEARWRPLTSAEGDVAFARLRTALNKLRIARPNLQAAYDALPVTTPGEIEAKEALLLAVVDCVSEAVIAYLRNPDRLRQQSVGATGDVGIGYDVGGREAAGGITLADDDLADIDAALAVASGVSTAAITSRRLRTSFPYYRPDVSVLPTP